MNLNSNAVIGEWPLETRPQGLMTIGQRTYVTINGFNPSDLSYGPGKLAVWDNAGDSIIEYVIRLLQTENDEQMAQRLNEMTENERLKELRKILHKDLHRH